MKKLRLLLGLVFILTFASLLCACNIESVEEHESKLNAESESLQSALENSDETTTSEADTTINNIMDESTTIVSGNSNSSTSNSISETTTIKETTTKEQETTTQEYIYVYLTVQCVYVYGNPALNGILDFSKIPNGYWFTDIKIPVKKGDSVYDALSNAQSLGELTFTSTSSKYITGINGLKEKAVGDESGWKYAVNNTTPSSSSSNYILDDGDKVTWYYVTKSTQTLN